VANQQRAAAVHQRMVVNCDIVTQHGGRTEQLAVVRDQRLFTNIDEVGRTAHSADYTARFQPRAVPQHQPATFNTHVITDTHVVAELHVLGGNVHVAADAHARIDTGQIHYFLWVEQGVCAGSYSRM
jgi:hypothetical protein